MNNSGWIRTNWLGLIGILIGLFGLSASYYFYTISVKEREPILLEAPFRPLLVEAASFKDSPLKIVNADGTVLEKDVSSMQFYFWNSGAEPIKKSHILKPLQLLLTAEDIQIIELRLLSSTRSDIINPRIDLETGKSNLINIDFDILEKDDGFSFQVLFAGNHSTPTEIKGTIESVKFIRSNKDITSFHFYKSVLILIILPLGGAVFALLMMFLVRPNAAKSLIPALTVIAEDIEGKGKKVRVALVVGVLIPITIMPIGLYYDEKEKGTIEAKTIESMLNIIPNAIRN